MSTVPQPNNTSRRRPAYRPSQADFILNVAPVELAGDSILGERLPYIDSEQFDALHTGTRETHLVRRDGDSVLCIPYAKGPPSLGGQPVVVDPSQDLYLAAFLVRQSLLAHLHALGRTILDFRPITVLANRPEDDYLATALPNGVTNSGLLRVSPVYELDARVLTPEGQEPFVALTIDVRVSRRILASCRDLIDAGVDVRGVYVKRSAEVRDPRVQPRLATVGQVETVDGDTLRLTDHREGVPTIPAAEAFPQARSEFFNRCVAALFPKHASLILTKVEQVMILARQGHECLRRLKAVRGYFAKQELSFPQGITCKVYPLLATHDKQPRFRFPRLNQAILQRRG